MRNRKTEDERIESVIRGLLKLPGNRRCINCNLLGPQYVCATFSTFVCTNCSGIHREFTHRIKSVSMAKFTPEEVTALQAGGNERAKQIYFKEWDPLRHSYPDSCNIHKLREFIKQIYVERRFTGGNSCGNLPRLRLDDKEEPYGSRKSSSFRLEFKSPHSNPSASRDETSFRYMYDESRSPKYTQKYARSGGYSRSPIKIEVVDDRFRDDDHKSRRLSNLESKLKQLSIDGQKNVNRSQLPVVRPLGEMFGEKVSSPQKVTSSGRERSVEENQSQQKTNNQENFIDLSPKCQPSDAAAAAAGVGPETPRISQPNENNWAIFEASTKDNDPKTSNTDTLKHSTTEATSKSATSAKNPLDLLLFELLDPVIPATSDMSQVSSRDNNDPTTTTVENACTWDFPPTSAGKMTTSSPNNTGVGSFTLTTESDLVQPSNHVPPHSQPCDTEDSNKVAHAHKSSSLSYLPSLSVGCSSTTHPTNAPVKDVASNNQPSVAPNTNYSSPAFTELSSQTTSRPTQDTRPDTGSQPRKVETRSSGRQELPEDLFSFSYLSGPAQLTGWQNVPPHGMQYYPNAMPPSALSVASNPSNPFEVTGGKNLSHTSSLPSMESLRGAAPAESHRTGLMHASSVGSLGTMASQSPSYASPASMGVYFNQVNNEKQPNRPENADNFKGDITGFGSLDNIQQSYGGHVIPGAPNSFSNTRGNPFG